MELGYWQAEPEVPTSCCFWRAIAQSLPAKTAILVWRVGKDEVGPGRMSVVTTKRLSRCLRLKTMQVHTLTIGQENATRAVAGSPLLLSCVFTLPGCRVQTREKRRQRRKRDKEVALLRRKMEDDRRRKGFELVPGSRERRGVIRAFLTEEEKMAMESQQKDLARESEEMISKIKSKHGIPKDKDSSPKVVDMAREFYSSKELPNELLPDHIRLNLTTEEIRDLKLVFDMFDVKGRGFIISYDLKKAAGMLGFTAKKHVFKEMIDELSSDHKGKVTFINFLEFIIKSQGEGPDPYEEIIQCFRLLDVAGKGFLTFTDLREASDHAQVRLSNKALREMLQEADVTGDGRITSDEFVHIMLQTNTFRLTNKGRTRLK
ncbi:uncharacterized protein LOC124268476 [Haliotis rubra]|uniref:uncharacterized protein LOC124268476 n=1 Tax=Haliotis rubra TaxID=36100 RepID=UPI001EE60196|nr:uncharacterized protein LOC124268476 [Haliotis rubra]